MSNETEKQLIIDSIEPSIEKALSDGKPHEIHIHIKRSKLTNLRVLKREVNFHWLGNDIEIKRL